MSSAMRCKLAASLLLKPIVRTFFTVQSGGVHFQISDLRKIYHYLYTLYS